MSNRENLLLHNVSNVMWKLWMMMSTVVENMKCAIWRLKLRAYLVTRLFLWITLAPLHDSHRLTFKTETKQCLIGFGNLAPGILPSLSLSSSPFSSTNRGDRAAISYQCVPQNSPSIHMEPNSFPGSFWILEKAIQPKRHGLVNKKVTETLFFLVMQFWRLFDRSNKHLIEMAGSNLR